MEDSLSALRFARSGPARLFNLFKDEWLVTRQASVLFFLSTLCVVIYTFAFSRLDLTMMSFWNRLPWGILVLLGPIAIVFLWLGMWRYWVRIDGSSVWVKRLWFLALLFGMWYGACLYYLVVYLPQVLFKRRAEA